MSKVSPLIILILTFVLACKKDSPSIDFIGTWELVSVNGTFSEYTNSSYHRSYKLQNISSDDNIISIDTYSYDIYRNSSLNEWYGDTINTADEYEFNVKMDINNNFLLQINEDYTKLSDNSVYSGFINSYWKSIDGTLDAYLIKLSFMEPDPIDFRSYIFLRSDLSVAMDDFKESGTITISFETQGDTNITYVFKKLK